MSAAEGIVPRPPRPIPPAPVDIRTIDALAWLCEPEHRRWVCWRYELNEERSKWTKPPFQPHGGKASNNNEQTWATYDLAWKAVQVGKYDGVGLVLHNLSGEFVAAIDLDDVLDPATGKILYPWVSRILVDAKSYAEITPSCSGLRILGTAPALGSIHTRIQHPQGGQAELFVCCARYITVSGRLVEPPFEELRDIGAVIEALAKLGQPETEPTGPNGPHQTIRLEDLSAKIVDLITSATVDGKPVDHPGAKLLEVSNYLKKRGHSFEASLALLAAHPKGVAGKFIRENRLEKEFHRAWDKGRTTNGGGQPEVLELLYGEQALAAPLFLNTVVRGVLHKGSLTVIYGLPKSGKSFLATDLGLAVADEEREMWMEHRIKQHGPVLYVACEGHGGFWKRLCAMLNVGQRMPDRFVLARGRPKLVANPDANGYSWVPHPDDIKRACKRVFEELGQWPVLVIIDTVFRSFGGANVNDSAHMNAYIEAATQIASKGADAGNGADNGNNNDTDTSIAVVLVHHSTKAGNTPAGSISLIGAADTLIATEKKNDGTHVWEVKEAKDDAETPPRAFVLEVVEGIPDAFSEHVSSCRVVDRGPAKQEAKPAKKAKEPAPKEPRSKTASGELVYGAMVGLFGKKGVPQEREIIPGKPKLRSVTRDQLREHLKAAGRLGVTEKGTVTAKARSWLHETLEVLAKRKEIVVNAEAVAWHPEDHGWWATAVAKPEPTTPAEPADGSAPVSEAANGGGA
jgi:hypothetical protein